MKRWDLSAAAYTLVAAGAVVTLLLLPSGWNSDAGLLLFVWTMLPYALCGFAVFSDPPRGRILTLMLAAIMVALGLCPYILNKLEPDPQGALTFVFAPLLQLPVAVFVLLLNLARQPAANLSAM